ncbi:MAG: NADH:flavin oxidoreductase/NADH oxidase family protein [Pseudomonadota bacterium]
MPAKLTDPLTLPCGATLKNRFAKAAMTEGIGTALNQATEEHTRLYGRWADGGCGLQLTGNVQVDRRYLERPGNVAIDGNEGLEALAAYAEAGKRGGTHIWMQINHPGRQAGATLEGLVGPSAGSYGEQPVRALEAAEIEDIRRRFVHVATTAQQAGFTGVQVHAAHGYLMSQFLSPLTNQRTDQWGGALENRARLLLDVVKNIRAAVGPAFPVSVKLNSSDFQKGGLTEDESCEVIRWLCDAGIDLLEISGGNYESQIMVGRGEDGIQLTKKASTIAREAYFLEFAARLRPLVSVPLMVTGGFRTRSAMENALAAGELDVIGLARPLCIDPDLVNKLLDGSAQRLPAPDDEAPIDAGTGIAYYFNQIRKLAAGEDADLEIDWEEQVERHVAFDGAANERYLATA